MTSVSLVRDLTAFSLQIAAVAIVLAAVLKFVPTPPRVRYFCLRFVLAMCLGAPWLLRVPVPANEPQSGSAAATLASIAIAPTDADWSTSSAPAARSRPFIHWTDLVVGVLGAGIVVRGLWLVIGLMRLRRLSRRADVLAVPECADLQEQLGTRATIAQVTELTQPATFGFLRPVVLLPAGVLASPPAQQRAVITHELFHVRRRDWLSVLAEEVLRTVLWFHPAILWLTSHLQLAREEIVDELTVRTTGDRRSYMEALLTFADSSSFRPAPAFARRWQLFHRIVGVSKEKAMSAPRVLTSTFALVAAALAANWYASTLFPMVAAVPATESALATSSMPQLVSAGPSDARSIRQVAGTVALPANRQGATTQSSQSAPHFVTPENPIPRRTRAVSPAWPPEFAQLRSQVAVNTLLTLDQRGFVAAAESAGCAISAPSPTDGDAICKAFYQSSVAAIRQWRYERPAQPPLRFNVIVSFRPGSEPDVVQSGTALSAFASSDYAGPALIPAKDWSAYLRETQDSLRLLAQLTGDDRISTQDFLTAQVATLSNRLRELAVAQNLLASKDQELAKLQQEMAQLNDALLRVEEKLREARRNDAAVSSTVRPVQSPPLDNGRAPLVAPSGRSAVPVGGSIAPPRVLQQKQPEYTPVAMGARVQGTVVTELLVDEEGRVADARVIRSIPLLDDAALSAVKQWRFSPSMLNGEPVPVLVQVEMHFALK